jgi:hypothetical protein
MLLCCCCQLGTAPHKPSQHCIHQLVSPGLPGAPTGVCACVTPKHTAHTSRLVAAVLGKEGVSASYTRGQPCSLLLYYVSAGQ